MKIGETQTFDFEIHPRLFKLVLPSLTEQAVITAGDCARILDIVRREGTKSGAYYLTFLLGVIARKEAENQLLVTEKHAQDSWENWKRNMKK